MTIERYNSSPGNRFLIYSRLAERLGQFSTLLSAEQIEAELTARFEQIHQAFPDNHFAQEFWRNQQSVSALKVALDSFVNGGDIDTFRATISKLWMHIHNSAIAYAAQLDLVSEQTQTERFAGVYVVAHEFGASNEFDQFAFAAQTVNTAVLNAQDSQAILHTMQDVYGAVKQNMNTTPLMNYPLQWQTLLEEVSGSQTN